MPQNANELPVNPYAPPAAPVDDGSSPSLPLARFGWVIAYAAISAVSTAAGLAAVLERDRTLFVAQMGVNLVAEVVGLAWLRTKWERLPPRLQQVKGATMPPSSLVLRHLIPLYGMFWMFRAQSALCDALNTRLHEKERPATAPSGLAMVACGVKLAMSLSGVLPAPARLTSHVALVTIWAVYMIAIERTFAVAFRRNKRTPEEAAFLRGM